jgi:DNA-directed RNA polymerase subunit RPC12/RpoP
MYTCGACGGIIEELGEMAVSSGGCICAQKKAEESANSTQHLQAEIAALKADNTSLKEGLCKHFFYINKGTTVVRCIHCGAMFPFENR